MNCKNHSFPAGQAGFVLGAVLLTTLTGCIGYVDAPRGEVRYAGPPPPPAAAVVVVQDDYVFYPGYDVYYNSHRHLYYWQDRGAWVSQPSPRGVSVNVLVASPSVRMDFHDSPSRHHAEVVQRYPRNWAPPGRGRGQGDNGPGQGGGQGDNGHGQGRGNGGR